MSDYTLETRTLHNLGRVKVVAKRILDISPDMSYLGEFSDFRQPASKDQKLVHRQSGYVMGEDGLWRDRRGRIVGNNPDDPRYPSGYDHDRYRREYEYTFHDNEHEKIAYALQDSKRMEDYERQEWSMLGIAVSVYYDGAEIGSSSVWGVESDSGEHYLCYCEREQSREAMYEARKWLDRNTRTPATVAAA